MQALRMQNLSMHNLVIKRLRHCMLTGLLLLVSPVVSATDANPWQTLLDHTHEYQLPNGLKMIVREDHRSPASIFQIWYRVGGSYEPINQTGVSHMLEHMMFKGSEGIAPGKLSEWIATYGGESNAATSSDYTYYYQLWSKQYLPLSFALEAERMTQLNFSAEEYIKEHQVVLEERRLRTEDNPQAKAYEQFQAIAYSASPYRNPVIGWPADISQLTREQAQAWYQQWYAPNNATIVVVGDVVPEEMYQLAKTHFGNLPSKTLPLVRAPIETAQLGRRSAQFNLPAKLPWLLMSFNVPALNAQSLSAEALNANDSNVKSATPSEAWKSYALYMLANVLDGGSSTRLEKHLVREQNLAAEISVSYDLFSRGDSQLLIHATPFAGVSINQLTDKIWQELRAIQQQPPTAAELDKIKTQLIAELIYQQDSIASQAEQIGQLESLGLGWKTFIDSFDAIKTVTPAQVQAVAAEFLTEQRVTLGELVPTQASSAAPSTSAVSHHALH